MPKRPPEGWLKRCAEHVGFHSPKVKNPVAVCAELWHHKMGPAAKRAALAVERAVKRKRKGGGRTKRHHGR